METFLAVKKSQFPMDNCKTQNKLNIARTAKAALHNLPGKSSLNVSFVFPVFLVFPVSSAHVHHDQYLNDQHNYHDHGDRDDHGDHDNHGDHEKVEGCTKAIWRLKMRKLEIEHKEVGGCLIACTLQLACVRKLEVSDQICAHCRVYRSE